MAYSKEDLRRRAKQLDSPTAAESLRVREALTSWLEGKPFRTVLTYCPTSNEIDIGVLVDRFSHLRWMTTRTPVDGWLTVHELPCPFERHRFGFLQPTDGVPPAEPAEIDLVLLPGLAFDARGVRLGHGGGHYDELVARCRSDVVLVGVIVERFVFQMVPRLAHDATVGWLATEEGVRPVVDQP